MLPTTAPIIEVVLGGRPRKFYFGFRAWKILGVNPMKQDELQAFVENMDVEKAAAWVSAGIQGHNALQSALARQDGQPEPVKDILDAESVLDMLDQETFASIMVAISDSAKADGDPEANPQ